MRVKSFIMHTEARAGRRRKLLFSPPHGRKFDFTLTHKAYVGGSLRLPRHQSDFIMSLILETGARKQRETRGKKGWMDGEKMLSINWKWKLLISFASKGKKKKSRHDDEIFFSFPSISHFHCCSHHWLLASESSWLLLWEACEKEEMGDRCGRGATPDEWTKSYPNVLSQNISYDIPFLLSMTLPS